MHPAAVPGADWDKPGWKLQEKQQSLSRAGTGFGTGLNWPLPLSAELFVWANTTAPSKESSYSQHLFLPVKITFPPAGLLGGNSSGWPFRWLALYSPPKTKLTALKRNEFTLGGGRDSTPDNVEGKADQKELLVLDTWAVLSAALGNVLSAQEKLERIWLICC